MIFCNMAWRFLSCSSLVANKDFIHNSNHTLKALVSLINLSLELVLKSIQREASENSIADWHVKCSQVGGFSSSSQFPRRTYLVS